MTASYSSKGGIYIAGLLISYTPLRRVLIHADCQWPSPTPSTTLPLYEMITCFI